MKKETAMPCTLTKMEHEAAVLWANGNASSFYYFFYPGGVLSLSFWARQNKMFCRQLSIRCYKRMIRVLDKCETLPEY